jgi:hypothetical protein
MLHNEVSKFLLKTEDKMYQKPTAILRSFICYGVLLKVEESSNQTLEHLQQQRYICAL